MSVLIPCPEANPRQHRAVHCGTAMELATPALAWAGTDYTFEPEGICRAELPPVWRCQCGFQLDAWLPGGDAPAYVPGLSARRLEPQPG